MSQTTRTDTGVLVVEDDRELADLYADWLTGRYRVKTAYDGEEALDLIDETVDVVLLDRMMPGKSGSAVLEEIRAAGIDCRVVMVSAVTPDLDIVQMGFDAYLEKPVDVSALHDVVDRMLTRADYDEKLQELFSLIERQDTLEAVKPPDVLATSEEYQSLTDQVQTAQRDVESLLSGLPDEDFRVAVERLQRTAAEREGDRRYESLTDDVLDTSREATVVIDSDGSVIWLNKATEELLGIDRDVFQGRQYEAVTAERFNGIEADDEPLSDLVARSLHSRGEEFDAVVHVPAATHTRDRWLEYWSAPIETGLYAGGRIEHYHDITGRYRREQYLRTLHRSTRALMAEESTEAIATRAVRTATSELELPYAATFVRDATTGDLVPSAHETTDAAVDPDLPRVDGGAGPVWTVFTDRTEPLDADAYSGDTVTGNWLDEAFHDWLLCPLGQQGVFLVATGQSPALSATNRRLAKTWAANTRRALERVERTRALRDRDRMLQRQNERLSRLDRVNRLIQSISPAVVSADSRAAVETEVCQRLLRLESVTGAWFADVDLPSDGTVRRAVAGAIEAYLSDVPTVSAAPDSEPVQASPPTPARQAFEAGEPVVVRDLFEVDPGPWWRDRALTGGTHTIVAIPIRYESTQFGAIEIHLDRPQGLTDDEIDALESLGVMIGHTIGSIRQRAALMTGGSVILTFGVGSDSGLSRLAEVAGAPLTVTEVQATADGTYSVFVTVDDSQTGDMEALADTISRETGASVLRNATTGLTCRLTLGADSPIRTLVEPGVALQQVEVADDPGLLTVSVSVPYSMDVREYVDSVTDAIDTIELVGKYEPASSRETGAELTRSVDERLTERQREVVRVAFYAGYFDQPRTADAETVATELGIAQSTFSQHLRAAERKLLEALYD